jgi:hypothetical protein
VSVLFCTVFTLSLMRASPLYTTRFFTASPI